MKDWFEVSTAVAMTALAIWQWTQLRKHPDDAALRPLAFGVTTLAALLVFAIDIPPFEYLHDYSNEASNGAWAFLFFCYSVFFILAKMSSSESDRRRGRRQVAAELAVWVAVVALSYVILRGGDQSFWDNDTVERYSSLRNWAYYLTADGYPFMLWLIGTIRAVGYLRLLRHRWARSATIGVIVAMGLMTVGVNGVSLVRQLLYVAYPGSEWPGLRGVYNVGRLGGQMLLAVSLASAPLLSVLVRLHEQWASRQQRRYAGEIEPLWKTMVEEFPQVRLPISADSERAAPALDRMMIEVSDGLAYLARWSGDNDDDRESVGARVVRALAAKRSAESSRWVGSEPSGTGGARDLPQWEPDFHQRDWGKRAEWMVTLTREVERHSRQPSESASVGEQS